MKVSSTSPSLVTPLSSQHLQPYPIAQVKDMALSSIGLDATFVDAELKLMESIVKGDGFADHFGE